MKYIMFEHNQGEGTKQRIPVIFPDHMVHSVMALSLMSGLEKLMEYKMTVVSAGQCNIGCMWTFGESETLKVKADKEDALVINSYDYEHGLIL